MKRFTRTAALLLCLFLAVPVLAETVQDVRPDYFTPANFAQMYNEAAEAFVDNYYSGKSEEETAQIKKDCLFAEENTEGQFLYLDSETGAVKAAFLFEYSGFTEKEPSILWNFYISRHLPGEAISLSAYTLMSMIGYTYRDTVAMADLREWFNKLAEPDDGFELPGYTLSMLVTDEYIQYMMLPPADKNPLLNQENM